MTEKQSNAKYVSLLARLTPLQKEQVTKICAAKNIDVTEFIRRSLDKSVLEADPSVLQGEVKFDLDAAYAQRFKLSEECKRLSRLLGDEYLKQLVPITQSLGLKRDFTNLESIIPKLNAYPIPTYEGSFDEDDMTTWIQYLQLCKKSRELKALIKSEQNKGKVIDPEANEPETESTEEQTEDSKVPKSLEEEHNARCYANIAAINEANRKVSLSFFEGTDPNDPVNIIRVMTKFENGYCHVNNAQAKILDAYLKNHPGVPFPRYKGKQEAKEAKDSD